MARCKDCIHDKVCNEWAVTSGIPFVNSETCEHFTPTADVVPKSEVERLEGDLIIERTRRENAVNSYHLSKADGAREAIEEAISTLEEKCLLLVTSNGKYCFEKEEVMFWLRSVAYNLKKKYTEGEA